MSKSARIHAHPCIVCNELVEKSLCQDHPWLYGLACPNCLVTCKSTSAKWFNTVSFECEKCGDIKNLTIHLDRLVCLNCIDHDSDKSSSKARYDWMEKITLLHLKNKREKRPLRVLSMFDGIGTALLVLDTLGFEIEEYFSCEIDDAALAVLNFHFHGRIKHLGSVNTLTAEKLRSLGHIDLLLGGSPCNELSLANPCRKGLYDPTTSGVLFFDFNRVLKFLQASSIRNGRMFFWLFENVAAMPHDFRDTISKTLNCKPATWDAIQFLPAKRARLFWGNIPEMHRKQIVNTPPPLLDDILEPYRKALVQSLPTLTTTFHSQTSGKELQLPVMQDGNEDGLLITERERLFGFPSHFTDADISLTKRQRLLGRAWSVPVIEEILFPLTTLYKKRQLKH